jgi:hypothetical protein
MIKSYSRHRDTYIYDVKIHRITWPPHAGRFYAQAVNIVRLESGQTVSVDAELQNEYGATPDEAFSKIERAVEAWAQRRHGQTEIPTAVRVDAVEERCFQAPRALMPLFRYLNVTHARGSSHHLRVNPRRLKAILAHHHPFWSTLRRASISAKYAADSLWISSASTVKRAESRDRRA